MIADVDILPYLINACREYPMIHVDHQVCQDNHTEQGPHREWLLLTLASHAYQISMYWAGDETDGYLHLILSYERNGPLPFDKNLILLSIGFAVILVASPTQTFKEDGLYQVTSSMFLLLDVGALQNTLINALIL